MKKITIALIAVLGIFLVGCAQPEPPADTSGVVNEADAPKTEGDASGGAPATSAPKTDATESSSEGG